MPYCDYCEAFYRGGHISDGEFRFCCGHCRDRGQAFKGINLPVDVWKSHVSRLRGGPCPKCGDANQVDVYESHIVWSAIVYARFYTKVLVMCRRCARQEQTVDLLTTAVAGWWGPGLLFTPFYIARNIRELMRKTDTLRPSERFQHLVRLGLLRQIAKLGSAGTAR